jgi:hypothetical protein
LLADPGTKKNVDNRQINGEKEVQKEKFFQTSICILFRSSD